MPGIAYGRSKEGNSLNKKIDKLEPDIRTTANKMFTPKGKSSTIC